MEKTYSTTRELKFQNSKKYFQNILEVKEFEGLETLVMNSDGVISWEELKKDGVVKIIGKKIEGIYWKGILDLRETHIETLWKIEEVKGNCYLNETLIKSLGKLRKIRGDLVCGNLKTLEDLENLREIGGSLYLNKSSIRSLGKLEKIGGGLDCGRMDSLEDFGKLENINSLVLVGVNIKFQLKVIRLLKQGKIKILGEAFFGGKLEGIMELLNQEKIPGILQLEVCGISIQGEALYRKKIDKLDCVRLRVSKNIADQIPKLYPDNRLNLGYFKELYGDNLEDIEDIEVRQYAKKMLIREYNIIREELKEKLDKIKKNNEGKELSNEEKKELRKRVIELGNKLEKEKGKIESFGIKLEDL